MQTYVGEVVSGTGHMSKRMEAGSIAMELYEKATGLELVPGSLNVHIAEDVSMPPNSKQIVRRDHEGEAIIYITPALLNNLECFAVRNKRAEEGIGRHPKNIIEIISAHKLREELGMKDGDQVTLQF